MPNNNHQAKEKKTFWDRALTIFGILSEAANIGIVIEVVAKWWPPLLTIGMGIFSQIVFFSDPTIYFFKALNRLTRLIGRKFFNIEFAEEKNGLHPWQTAADILTLTLYSLAIPFFIGAAATGPIGVTIGWSLGLCGLFVVGVVDYRFQKIKAEEEYSKALAVFLEKQQLVTEESSPELKAELIVLEATKNKLYQDYSTKKTAYGLYGALLLGLACLLICGSAALFSPPAVAPVLFIIAKVASAFLAGVAVARFYNWVRQPSEKPDDEPETVKDAVEQGIIPNTPTAFNQLRRQPTPNNDADKIPPIHSKFILTPSHFVDDVGLRDDAEVLGTPTASA